MFLGGAPATRLEAQVSIPRSDPLPDRYRIEVTFADQAHRPSCGTPCRAFLVERGVLDRLRQRPAPALVCQADDDRLTLRDLTTGKVRATLAAGERMQFAAIVDEKRVALLSALGKVQIWDTPGGTVRTLAEQRDRVHSWGLVTTSRGEIAWGNSAGAVFCLNVAEGGKRLVHEHRSPVTALAVLPDGRLISGHMNGILCLGERIWATCAGERIDTIAPVSEQRLALLSSRGKLRLWNLESEQEEVLDVATRSLASLPDGRLATAGADGLKLWDLGSPGAKVLTADPVLKVLVGPGPRVVKVAVDDSLWVWNLQTGHFRMLRPGGGEFLTPLACGLLRPWLAEEDEGALAELLDNWLVSDEFAVQQALSALPEIEGKWEGEKVVLEAEIPAGSPNISELGRVVIVFDGGMVSP